MRQNGFTIVELIIVITIMGILLTLSVVNVRSSQLSSRDAERVADIETIASHLETYYTSGHDNSTALGQYPSTQLTTSITSDTLTTYLRDIDTKSVIAPDADDNTSVNAQIAATFIPATCSGVCDQRSTYVTPQPTFNQYVYQPLQSNGTLCTDDAQECRKFNLFYKTESDSVVKMITSKNQ